jgi:hypothetical protein
VLVKGAAGGAGGGDMIDVVRVPVATMMEGGVIVTYLAVAVVMTDAGWLVVDDLVVVCIGGAADELLDWLGFDVVVVCIGGAADELLDWLGFDVVVVCIGGAALKIHLVCFLILLI